MWTTKNTRVWIQALTVECTPILHNSLYGCLGSFITGKNRIGFLSWLAGVKYGFFFLVWIEYKYLKLIHIPTRWEQTEGLDLISLPIFIVHDSRNIFQLIQSEIKSRNVSYETQIDQKYEIVKRNCPMSSLGYFSNLLPCLSKRGLELK